MAEMAEKEFVTGMSEWQNKGRMREKQPLSAERHTYKKRIQFKPNEGIKEEKSCSRYVCYVCHVCDHC